MNDVVYMIRILDAVTGLIGEVLRMVVLLLSGAGSFIVLGFTVTALATLTARTTIAGLTIT